MPVDPVHGQVLCKHLACGLCAGLHGSWRAAIAARRERDACACTLVDARRTRVTPARL